MAELKIRADVVEALPQPAKDLLARLESESSPFTRTKKFVTIPEEAMAILEEDPRLNKGLRLFIRRARAVESDLDSAAAEKARKSRNAPKKTSGSGSGTTRGGTKRENASKGTASPD